MIPSLELTAAMRGISLSLELCSCVLHYTVCLQKEK